MPTDPGTTNIGHAVGGVNPSSLRHGLLPSQTWVGFDAGKNGWLVNLLHKKCAALARCQQVVLILRGNLPLVTACARGHHGTDPLALVRTAIPCAGGTERPPWSGRPPPLGPTGGVLHRLPAGGVSGLVDSPSPPGAGSELGRMLLRTGVRPSPRQPGQTLFALVLSPGPRTKRFALLKGDNPTIGSAVGFCLEPGAEPGDSKALAFCNCASGGENPRHCADLEGSTVLPGKRADGPSDHSTLPRGSAA